MSEMLLNDCKNLSKVLALLIADGNYTYVDKLANAPSADLAMFYLREAMRDFHSILRQGKTKNKKAIQLLNEIITENSGKEILQFLDASITNIYKILKKENFNPKKLREICSLIASKALAIAANYIDTGKGSSEGGEE